ncbi:MAG: biotin/lipoyl-containing protein, partial [Rhizomicrobium sp.]
RTHIAQPAEAGSVRKINGDSILFLDGDAWPFSAPRPRSTDDAGPGDGAVLAPMPGTIIQVETAKGKHVRRGERLLVLEAMKMEYVLVAPFDGTVVELTALAGSQVEEGVLLTRIEKAD